VAVLDRGLTLGCFIVTHDSSTTGWRWATNAVSLKPGCMNLPLKLFSSARFWVGKHIDHG